MRCELTIVLTVAVAINISLPGCADESSGAASSLPSDMIIPNNGLRGSLDSNPNASLVAPNNSAPTLNNTGSGNATQSGAVAPKPKVQHKGKRNQPAVLVPVGLTDRVAKTSVGLTDRTAKTGVGLTDRAAKTSIGLPRKAVKETLKAVF